MLMRQDQYQGYISQITKKRKQQKMQLHKLLVVLHMMFAVDEQY